MNCFLLCFSLFARMLIASDNSENIKFNGVEYPIFGEVETSEKTDILFETPISEKIDKKFNRVVIQGEVNDRNIEFQLWTSSPTYDINNSSNSIFCAYSGEFRIYPNGRFWAKFDIGKETHYIKFVVINAGVRVKIFEIKIYEFQVLNISKKKESEEITITSSTTDYSLTGELPFKLIRRDEWKANPPKEPYIKHTPLRITIHHTAGYYPQTFEDALSEIQFIQDYHQNAKGWIDIGYHFLIDPLGNIFEGRPVMVVGAHVGGKNTNNVGISLMGNYHPPQNNEVTQKSIDSIVILMKYLKDEFKIPKNEIYGHRDLSATDCPGDLLYLKIPEIKNKVFADTTTLRVNIEIDNSELENKIKSSIYNSW